MHHISFAEQKLSQIGSVLTGHPGNQRNFIGHRKRTSIPQASVNESPRSKSRQYRYYPVTRRLMLNLVVLMPASKSLIRGRIRMIALDQRTTVVRYLLSTRPRVQ